ncbi:MAG: DUF3352 domain-containing protein, partial [Phycisphaerales bacterium]
VDIDDFSQVRAQFEKTILYKLYKDPAMKPFIDDFKAKWKQQKQASQNEAAQILLDANVLPEGRAAVALVLDKRAQDVNEPPAVFISQWGRNLDKIKEAVGQVVEKAVEKGTRRQSEEYRGVTITSISPGSSKTLFFCFVDDLLIMAMSPDILKFTVAQAKGAGSPTLADDSDYNTTFRALGEASQGQISFYVNIKQAIKTTLDEDADGKARALVDNLGLTNVTSFGGFIDLAGGPGGASFGKALLKIDGQKKGVCKLLEVESAPLRMPQFISPSSSSVSVFNLNIKKAYAELGNILGKFSPQMAAMLYMPLLPPGPQGEPPLQLKGDLIDHLGSQIVLAQSIGKLDSAGGAAAPAGGQPLAAQKTLAAIAIGNRNALEKSLSTLHSKMIVPGNPDSQRQLLGHTIYTVDVSGFLPFLGGGQRAPMRAAAMPGVPKAPPLAFTVTDTHLILGGEATVEQAIRALGGGQTESIDAAKWFRQAKASIPSVVGLAGFQDVAASGELVWSMMRQAQKKDEGANAPQGGQIGVGMQSGSLIPNLMFSQGGQEMFDFSLLPEFDAVRKYFGLSAS